MTPSSKVVAPLPSTGRRPGRVEAFTLVELLLVVAVLALLAAMLFPVLAQARQRAYQSTCLTHLQQIGRAQMLYLQDSDERFPFWYLPWPAKPGDQLRFWPEYLQPYLHREALLRDPSFSWPGKPATGRKLADYALYTWGPGGQGTPEEPYWRWAGPPLALADIRRPTETFNLMDGYTTTVATLGELVRHGQGMNASFLDGHARWIVPGELKCVDTDGRGAYWFHYAAADR